MTWTRYEILLPLCYNDGRKIESDRFDQTNWELANEFLATTTDTMVAFGTWIYRGIAFRDRLKRIIVDVPGVEPADDFFREYKKTLKTRFDQIEIWITAHELRIL